MKEFEFQKAQPVWAVGRETEKNMELAFRAVLKSADTQLYLAASTVYRIRVNGEFAAAGPARAAHGYYSVDRIDLTDRLTEEENVVVIEVVGYNVNTYDTLDLPSFLTAEFVCKGEVTAWTGGEGIKAYELKERVQKVQRYSFQRASAECYRLKAENRAFYRSALCEKEETDLSVQAKKAYLERTARMPEFEILNAKCLLETGKTDFAYICPNPKKDRSYTDIGEKLKGYAMEELEEHLSDEAQNMAFTPDEAPKTDRDGVVLHQGYALYELPYNATGFLKTDISCEEECTVYILFDEVLSNSKVDSTRMDCCNCFKFTVDRGEHSLMPFAAYTMKYVQIAVKGKAVIRNLQMVEYKHPQVPFRVDLPEDETLRVIYDAAVESFRANAVDVFSDCPSRERAGWLCDSFFTARVEHVLTGECVLEKTFLSHFLMADRFVHLPEGMLPMCYPADHNDGIFIPNWSMWFVMELEEYLIRSGDREFVDRAKKKVYGLLDYFRKFENSDGLLEKLESWVFVEWSRANDKDVVQDINFPTNMIYMKMLETASRLYEDSTLAMKAARLRPLIKARSRKGIFYTDNERYTQEGLSNPGNCTEVCQYYAFFTGVADKVEDAQLWEILKKDFGYRRKETRLYPEVAFANAFIGNYLRIELLYRDGDYDQVIDNIRGYFINMARTTGTLWEHDSTYASCNHGFASHVIYWLAGIYGIRENR